MLATSISSLLCNNISLTFSSASVIEKLKGTFLAISIGLSDITPFSSNR